jgi:glutamine synthetase
VRPANTTEQEPEETPMPAAYSLDALKADVKGGVIDTVIVAFPDMQGRLIGKRFQAEFFLDGAIEETHGCDYLLANDIDMEPVPGYDAANWARGYGDFVMKPDVATLTKAAWLPGTAIILADVVDHHHHEPVSHSPRAILKAQLERLKHLGFTANFASELEFYLFDESFRSAWDKGYKGLTTAGYYIQDYHIFQTTKEEPVMRDMRRLLQASGIPIENSKGEWGPGQEELNVRYADALTMADRHVVMKNAMKEIAHSHGKAITFMAKWDYALAGSSSHIHMSLAKAGKNAFHDPKAELGMSGLMQHYVAGLLTYAHDVTYFLAPYINSYKRFQAGTFAPTKAIWSPDNRTAGFRLCGEGTKGVRIECRIGGADLNPYLAFAALIAAGLKGIEDKLKLEPAYSGDAYVGKKLREVPKTLRDAIEAMKKSKMLRAALGDAVVEHYVHTAQWEQSEYDRRVTDWELKRGFERS